MMSPEVDCQRPDREAGGQRQRRVIQQEEEEVEEILEEVQVVKEVEDNLEVAEDREGSYSHSWWGVRIQLVEVGAEMETENVLVEIEVGYRRKYQAPQMVEEQST